MKRYFACLPCSIVAALSFALCLPGDSIATERVQVAAVKSYRVTSQISGARNGTISPSSALTVRSGGSVEFVVKPKRSHLIESLTVNGAPRSDLPRKKGQAYSLRIKKVTENKTVTVKFATARTTKALSIGSQLSVVDAK